MASNGLKRFAHIYSSDLEAIDSINRLLEHLLTIDFQVFSDLETESQWLLGSQVTVPTGSTHLNIESSGLMHRLNLDDVLFISRFDRRTIIQLKKEELATTMSLAQFEEILPFCRFMRIYKS